MCDWIGKCTCASVSVFEGETFCIVHALNSLCFSPSTKFGCGYVLYYTFTSLNTVRTILIVIIVFLKKKVY